MHNAYGIVALLCALFVSLEGAPPCFVDENPGARTLAAASLVSSNMTIEVCQGFCYAAGFRLAGVEFGTECYCDYFIHLPHSGTLLAPATDCNITCGGNHTQICGGASRMNFYSNGTVLPPVTPPVITGPNELVWKTTGCWTDNFITDNRTLPISVEPAGGVTPQTCINACAAAGQTTAGVEFGTECWCGTILNPKATPVLVSSCNMPCKADPTFFCGGSNFIGIYGAAV